MTDSEALYFEDLEIGFTRDLGERTITREAIVDFADRFDPQPMHLCVDDDCIASGWHTASACMRLLVDGLLSDLADTRGMGVDTLRWYRPVEPGDTLHAAAEVVDAEGWDDRRGKVALRVSAENQRGTEVFERTDLVLVERGRRV